MVVSTEPSGSNAKSAKKKRASGNGSGGVKSSRRNKQPEAYYDQPRHVGDQGLADDHLYDVVRPRGKKADDNNTYMNVAEDHRAVYQNMDDMYDRPNCSVMAKNAATTALLVQSHYENLTFDEHHSAGGDGDEEDHTYLNLNTYDIPRSGASIYDHPRNNNVPQHPIDSDYDYPKGLIPLSARLLLNASRQNLNCDEDSLDDRQSSSQENDSSDDGLTELRSGSSPDEGIGNDLDPKGILLGAIAEEDEMVENCYSNIIAQPKKNRPGTIKSTIGKKKSAKTQTAPNDSSDSSVSSLSNDDEPKRVGGNGGVANKSLSRRSSTKANGGGNGNSATDPIAAIDSSAVGQQEERTQADRCIEVYHETLRQRTGHSKIKETSKEPVVSVQSAKEDNHSTIRRMKKLLPSVRALRSQFEPGNKPNGGASKLLSTTTVKKGKESAPTRKWKSTSNFNNELLTDMVSRSRSSSLGSLDEMSTTSSASSSGKNNTVSPPALISVAETERQDSFVSTVSIIANIQSNKEKDYDLYRPRHSTAQWNPVPLLEDLYKVQDLKDEQSNGDQASNDVINMEGALDKLPSGRRKATFWNAWKRRYFQAKDGYLHCYQNSQSEKASIVLQLAGGQVEMDNNMISIDDGKGHYMVVRGSSKSEAERWYQALLSQVSHKGGRLTRYAHPKLVRDPSLLKDVIILDLGSSSIRAGILSAHATLPQVFFPSVAAVDKNNGQFVSFGMQAVTPDIRGHTTMAYPLRTTNKISKYMLDMEGVTGLIRTAFKQLNVDPSNYGIQVSLPRHLNQTTMAELARLLFDEFGLQSVNLTHQSILSLLSYNSTSGIVVDIGERIDIVPIMDGYMLESSCSRVPYGGQQLVDHLRHFLVQQRCSLFTDVETYLIRHILEKLAYVAGPEAGAYGVQLSKAKSDPSTVRGTVDLRPFANGNLPWENVSLELGRFQITEGLFHPEAWGLDNPGVQKLVHKAIQDCSVDIRKEMVGSIFLSGGVTLLPNFPERLESELDRLTPSHLVPKVHASPYRYHASFIGACALSNSPAYEQSRIGRQEWFSKGSESVRKWKS